MPRTAFEMCYSASRLGENAFIQLSEQFYCHIFEHNAIWFNSVFQESSRKSLPIHFSDYLFQRCGGTGAYSDQRGFPTLLNRHCHFNITADMAEKWLLCMQMAIEELAHIFDEDSKHRLMNFLSFSTNTLLCAHQTMNCTNCRNHEYDHLNE